jgi:6,7-dimethyl-8-ribityllumazine synthase
MSKSISLGIVVSKFNEEITGKMLTEAQRFAKEKGAKVVAVTEVPGAYEIPFAADKLLGRKDVDAVATLGCVIKGETLHDEVIMMTVCKTLCDLSLKYKKPVGLGISGPGITEAQAIARIEDYAQRAVGAAIYMTGI